MRAAAMRLWLVMIDPAAGVRYIDSAWAADEAAGERLDMLRASFAASGNPAAAGHKAYLAELRVEDARIVEREQEQEAV